MTQQYNFIEGTDGQDNIEGTSGADIITGNNGSDTIHGGDGDDVIAGSGCEPGNLYEEDNVSGGAGKDLFIAGDGQRAYYTANGENDCVIIHDFNALEDSLQLHGSAEDYTFEITGNKNIVISYQGEMIVLLRDYLLNNDTEFDLNNSDIIKYVEGEEIICHNKGALGDKVWYDLNRDGIQDAGETGVEGVAVTLTGGGEDGVIGTADDTTHTTITDAEGNYRFDDLTPGVEYQVNFSDLPQDYVFTTQNLGSDDALDSDADVSTGNTDIITLAPGEYNNTIDAGIIQLNPDIQIEKFVNGFDADSAAEAVEIAAGEEVTFTYEVTNTGEVAFAADEVIVIDDNGTADDTSDDFNPTFVGGDTNNNGFLDVDETWLYSKSESAQNLSTVIDFEGFTAGTVIDNEYGDLGVTISATGGANQAMIFNTFNPTGGDYDLATNNQGNVLIISEDGDSHDPDDNAHGGTITFDFDQATDISTISFLDIEEAGGTIRSFDTNGNLIDSQAIPIMGDGGQADVNINDNDVARLEVSLSGSGAITGLELGGTYSNVGTVVAGNVSDSDKGFYTNPAKPEHIIIEAEDMHLSGYRVEHVGDNIASDGEVIKLSSHDGHASTHFTGESGYYQVEVAYYDENDGESVGKFKIGGETIDSWTFDQHLGSNVASAGNRVVRTVTDSVYIEHGEEIKLSGKKNSYEFARFDSIKFTEVESSGNDTDTTPKTGTIVGSSHILEGDQAHYQVKLDGVVDEDTYVTVSINNGSAKQADGYHLEEVKNLSNPYTSNLSLGEQGQLYTANSHDRNYSAYYWNDTHWFSGDLNELSIGADNLTDDFEVTGAQGDKIVVKIEAGSDTSESFEVSALKEIQLGKMFSGETATEGTENFSLNIDKIGDHDVHTGEKTIDIYDNYANYSPIAFDLNDDGIQTLSIKEGVEFDMLNSGKAVNTGWLSGEDGFLAVDNNGDGEITSRAELFGGDRGEGFAKLKTFDSNKDGLVNESDSLFGSLKLWQDANENGITDEGELVSLESAGITDLNTNYTDVFAADVHGNVHGEHSNALKDGSSVDMVDVYFQVAI